MFGNNSNFNNQNPFGGYTPQGYQSQQPSQQPPAKLESLDDLLSGSGAKSFFNADSQPGQSVTGVIDLIETSQMRDFQTKQPAYWNDGRPQMQIHIVLQTTLRDPSVEDDDGRRSLWIKGWGVQLKAFREACRQAGVKAPKAGDELTATFTGLGERGNAPQPPKIYAYRIVPANGVSALLAPQAAPQQPAYQQTPRQTVGVTPVAQPTPQYAQPATYQQPQHQPRPQVNEQQVRQLASLGKTPTEIAGLLNLDPQVIQAILQPATASTGGADDNPEF